MATGVCQPEYSPCLCVCQLEYLVSFEPLFCFGLSPDLDFRVERGGVSLMCQCLVCVCESVTSVGIEFFVPSLILARLHTALRKDNESIGAFCRCTTPIFLPCFWVFFAKSERVPPPHSPTSPPLPATHTPLLGAPQNRARFVHPLFRPEVNQCG